MCNTYPWKAPLAEQANAVVDPTTGKSLEFYHLIKSQDKKIWATPMANELGRLAQGVGNRIKGMDTIIFTKYDQVPQGKLPTHARIVCDIRPQKEETHQTRITVGSNLVNYQGNVSTPTAELSTAKLLFNSVFPEEIIKQYQLENIVRNGNDSRIWTNTYTENITSHYRHGMDHTT
eukprot:8364670-Ditylum_brightwellii.AAC.1